MIRRLRAAGACWQAIRHGAASGSAAEREAVPLRTIACKQAPTWLAAILLLAATAHAEIEFTGIFVTSRQSLFQLTENSTGETGWRRVGEKFAGAEIAGYDAPADTLTLAKDGAKTRVQLKDAKVKSAAQVEIVGTVTFGGGQKVEVTRGTLVFDRENEFPLGDGLVCKITPSLRPDGAILYKSSFERTGADGKIERLSSPSVIARAGASFGIQVGDLGYSFTPKTSPTP